MKFAQTKETEMVVKNSVKLFRSTASGLQCDHTHYMTHETILSTLLARSASQTSRQRSAAGRVCVLVPRRGGFGSARARLGWRAAMVFAVCGSAGRAAAVCVAEPLARRGESDRERRRKLAPWKWSEANGRPMYALKTFTCTDLMDDRIEAERQRNTLDRRSEERISK